MASTFSTQKVALNEIAQKIQNNRQLLTQCRSFASAADAELGGMPTTYGTLITDINAALTGDPTNPAIQNLKAEKDKLVAEFQALKTAATSMKTATDAVSF